MENKKEIFITGDRHADFRRFGSQYFGAPEGSIVIICGDFGGVWNGSPSENYWLDWLEEKPYTFLFVDGNHENFDMLNSYPVSEWNGGKVHFIRKNILHLMRGQIFDIEGVRFFTFGGARSHDISDGILSMDDPDIKEKIKKLNREQALFRIDHLSWWKEEMPSETEMAEGLKNLEKAGNKVDCILSHCAPTSIQDVFSGGLYEHDTLTDYFEKIRRLCDFKLWFFGHYHDDKMIGQKYIMLYGMIVSLDDYLKQENSFNQQMS